MAPDPLLVAAALIAIARSVNVWRQYRQTRVVQFSLIQIATFFLLFTYYYISHKEFVAAMAIGVALTLGLHGSRQAKRAGLVVEDDTSGPV